MMVLVVVVVVLLVVVLSLLSLSLLLLFRVGRTRQPVFYGVKSLLSVRSR